MLTSFRSEVSTNLGELGASRVQSLAIFCLSVGWFVRWLRPVPAAEPQKTPISLYIREYRDISAILPLRDTHLLLSLCNVTFVFAKAGEPELSEAQIRVSAIASWRKPHFVKHFTRQRTKHTYTHVKGNGRITSYSGSFSFRCKRC